MNPSSGISEATKQYLSRLAIERIAAFSIGLLVFALLAATNRDYGYAIDEASYVYVAREERLWFRELADRRLSDSLSADSIDKRWHFLETPTGEPGKHSNFNLPLSMHLMNLGWALSSWVLDELTSYRLGAMVLFSLCAADVFRTIGRSVNWPAGLFAAVSLVAMPRVFGHAHLAATETPLSSFWLMTCLAMVRMTNGQRSPHAESAVAALVVATMLALTMSVKFTGWFLAPAVVIWLTLFRPKRWIAAILLCVVLPPIVIVLLTPNLWHDPVARLLDSLSVARRNPWTIATYHLGEGYSGRLPGSSGLVLLGVTTPISLLVLALTGLVGRVGQSSMWAIALPTLTLLAARMAGYLPTHDGERQFLPVCYGVAVLAGFGFDFVTGRVSGLFQLEYASKARLIIASILGGACLLEPIADFWKYRGHGLCYYNRAVGGLSGADKLGFEVSYWFESMTNEEWRRMLADLPPGARVFLRPDHPGLENLREWGVWRHDLRSVGIEDADYYVLYAKRAAYLVPDEVTGKLMDTDLGLRARGGPMSKEIRFEGVRLAGVCPARGAFSP